MNFLEYSHYFSLPSQGNVYTITNLELTNGTSKLLVASLKREIFCFEYLEKNQRQLIPTAREVSFTYIPTGAEIISLDAYNKSHSEKSNEFVVGITIIKNSNDSDSLETYLNIYSGWEASEDFNIESIAQNCQNVELNFIPYQLLHSELVRWNDNNEVVTEKIFLLTGSDHYIHVFYEHSDHLFRKLEDTKEFLPELVRFPSPVTWMDVKYLENYSIRLVALGCECGYVKFIKVCTKTMKIINNFSTRLDNYITNVRLFVQQNEINLVVVSSILNPIVFHNVSVFGLSNYTTLARHNSMSILTCCDIFDVDLDGNLEIVIGSSTKEIVVYKRDESEELNWNLKEIKKVSSPVFNVRNVDLTGDALKELVVFSMKGVHVLQHNSNYVLEMLERKLRQSNCDENVRRKFLSKLTIS